MSFDTGHAAEQPYYAHSAAGPLHCLEYALSCRASRPDGYTVSCVAQGSCVVSGSDRPLDPWLQYISSAIAGRDSTRKRVSYSKEANLISGRSC